MCDTYAAAAPAVLAGPSWPGAEGDRRLKRLEKALGREGVEFRPESYKWSVVQALLSRGDRRLSRLLLLVRQYGDSLGSFRRAFKELQVGGTPCLSGRSRSAAMHGGLGGLLHGGCCKAMVCVCRAFTLPCVVWCSACRAGRAAAHGALCQLQLRPSCHR